MGLRLTPVMGKLNPRKPSLPSQEFACFWCTVLTLFRKRVSDLNCISKLQSRTQLFDRFELVQALTRQSRAGWLVLLWRGAFTLFPSRNLNNDPVEMTAAQPGEFFCRLCASVPGAFPRFPGSVLSGRRGNMPLLFEACTGDCGF